jgi:hypothetical protein
MALTATMILVLALLGFRLWRWLWHIGLSLALVLLLYETWPWLSQMHTDNAVMSWLTQIHVPQVSATNTQSGRQYVFPQGTDESRDHFEALGEWEYPRPYPKPILVDRWRGHDVYWWKGECWFLRHTEEPYRFLCVVHARLQWCWPSRPSASAVPCKSPETGEYGWCWKNGTSYRSDS